MVDLVITSVFPTKKGVKERDYYKSLETGEAIKNEDTNGACRYRDFNLLRFWFRSIEKNCSGFRKIFLIVQDEDQIPEGLDTTNPKLRVVYHREFIPEELLPTFCTNTIELHMHRIPDLGEKFIYFNDDMFILQPMPESKFFKDGKPVYNYRTGDEKSRKPTNNFTKMLLNNKRLEDKYKKTNTVFKDAHLLHPMLKSMNTKIYDENKCIYDSVALSKFRSEKNFTDWVYTDITQLLGKSYTDKSVYDNCIYLTLRPNSLDFKKYFKCNVVCFNDTVNLSNNYNEVKRALLKAFINNYSNMSSFEKKDKYFLIEDELEKDLDLDDSYNNIIISTVDQPNFSNFYLKVDSLENLDFNSIKYELGTPKY